MPSNNLRQAQVPVGAEVLSIMPGTAPGLKAVIQGKTLYAVPGVPWEMKQMVSEDILPDIRMKAGISGIIRSKTLRTWGESESGLAERLAGEIERLDREGGATIAFLASGIEGLKVRLTVKGGSESEVETVLNDEAEIVSSILGDEIIFSYNDQTIEEVIIEICRERDLTLGVAESLTGGLIGNRITSIPGSSDVFNGSIVAYSADVKATVLGVPDVPSVSEEAVEAMVVGVCRALNADVGIAVTGEAGPDPIEEEVGRVWMATSVNGVVHSTSVKWPFDRERIRQFTTISVLNALRLRLEKET